MYIMRSALITFAGLLFSFICFGKEPFGHQSLALIENKGQIQDQYGHARNDIQYKIAGGHGLSIFIGNGAIHYQWSDNSKVKSQKSTGASPAKLNAHNEHTDPGTK